MSISLRKLEVSGVRSIGWLPGDAAGLTIDGLGKVNIISAPNGVGKTSVVEAIALALTGEPRRRGNCLPLEAVVHAPRPEGAQPRVCLSFTNEKHLIWTDAVDGSSDGNALRASLTAATELLSDDDREPDVVANLLRLTHLLPQGWGERFTDQKGSARWSMVERALGFEGLRAAVSKGQRRGTLGAALSSSESASEAAAAKTAGDLDDWRTLASTWRKAREGAKDAGALPPSERTAALRELGILLAVDTPAPTIADLRAVVAQRRTRLRSWSDSVSGMWKARASAEAQLAGAVATLGATKDSLDAAEEAHNHAKSVLLAAEAEAARQSLPELQTQKQLRERLLEAVTALRTAAELESEAATLERAERALEDLTNVEALATAAEEAKAILAELRRAEGAALEELRKLEHVHGELSTLLRQLRPHVQSRPDACPVCSTEFGPDELLSRVDAKLEDLGGPALASARAKHQAAETSAAAQQVRCDAALARLESALSTRAAAKETRAAAADRIRALLSTIPADIASAGSSPSSIAESLRMWASSLADLDTTVGDLTEADAREELAKASTAVLQAEELLRRAEEEEAELAPGVSIDLARHRADASASALQRCREAHGIAEQRHSDALKTRDGAVADWLSTAPPSIAAASAEDVDGLIRKEAESRREVLDAAEAKLDLLASSAETYANLTAVQEAEAALRRQAESLKLDLPSPPTANAVDAIEEQLVGRDRDAQARLSRLKTNAATVRGWISGLSTELQGYENDCLEALSPTVSRFLDVLAPTMRWRLKLDKHRNTARATFANPDAPSVDPFDLLSEGEHTAVALAHLLAFNNEFRWSTWPALVLDDPFQAADVVRVGALLDLLRGMALERDTQVIMTTHDPQLAEWATTKMTNGGVEARWYELERDARGIRAVSRV